MKRVFITLLIMQGLAFSLFASDTQVFTVNGLKIIFKKNDANEIISTGLYFRGGAMQLTRNNAGIEDFALQVAVKATENFPKDDLNARLEKMNTIITSSSSPDYSVLEMKCVKKNLMESWKIYADIINHPSFNSDDVELIRERKIAAIKQKRDDPDSYLAQLARDAFYTGHPYGLDVDGSIESVASFRAEDLKAYLNSRIKPEELLMVVVGNADIAQLKELVEDTFKEAPASDYKDQTPPAVAVSAPSIKIAHRELPTKYIMGICSAPAFGSDEGYAMALAMSILRDRLFEEVRTKRNLSYAPSSGYSSGFASNAYIYVTAVDPDSTIRVMRREVEKISSQAISDKELKDKLNVFLTGYYMGQETNASQRNLLAKYELAGLGYERVSEILDHYKKVTSEAMLQVCQKYLKNFQFVMLGNPDALAVKDFMF